MFFSSKQRLYRHALYLAACLTFSCAVLLGINPRFMRVAMTMLNQMPWMVEQRVMRWDGRTTPGERICQSPPDRVAERKHAIPNIVHFILIGDEGVDINITFVQFLAIKSALVRMQSEQIKLHTYNGLRFINNTWWEQLAERVTVVTHDRHEVKGPGQMPIAHFGFAHQADFLRLDIQRREGGIYLDTDVYVLKPFTGLLNNSKDAIMGNEGGNRYGLCNAVIISRAGSEFVEKWWDAYASFDERVWNLHSVRIPKQLEVQYPDLVCALSQSAFFWPTWAKDHIRYMHERLSVEEAVKFRAQLAKHNGSMYEDQLAYHATGSALRGLSSGPLTQERLMNEDTRFNILLRDVYTALL